MKCDQNLINKVSSKAGGQVHKVGEVLTVYRYSSQFLEKFPDNKKSQEKFDWAERVLISFLVTKDIRESIKLIDNLLKERSI